MKDIISKIDGLSIPELNTWMKGGTKVFVFTGEQLQWRVTRATKELVNGDIFEIKNVKTIELFRSYYNTYILL